MKTYRVASLNHEARTRPVTRFERIQCGRERSLAVERYPGQWECARCGDRVYGIVATA